MSGACARLLHLGRERQPLLLIDDFADDPLAMIEEACALRWGRHGAHYPGPRAALPPARVQACLQGLEEPIASVFGIARGRVLEAWYSLVTTPPSALAPIQRLPHVDGLEPQRLALLHYLDRGQTGGTAFYRQRATGFESLDAGRYPRYTAALQDGVARHGLPPAAYIAGDTVLFEQVARIEARFNRAILYRGNLLHCADIPAGAALGSDPRSGRLTANTFLVGSAA